MQTQNEWRDLTPEETRVIVEKGTERAFSGKYTDHDVPGVYTCRRCGAALYRSDAKFHSGCGWPSFDEAVPGAVRRRPDADGRRTEITCTVCDGHLGHVFEGEGLTPKNTRHCVNSLSMDFMESSELAAEFPRAVFAGGCFWGIQKVFDMQPGVVRTLAGYTGGETPEPSYRQVCSGTTGHAEAVEVLFDPRQTDFERLARLFFQLHDPSQVDRQGPDIGEQYRSAVFVVDDDQRRIMEKLVSELESDGVHVATKVEPEADFWPAEDYHQHYLKRKASPGCNLPGGSGACKVPGP